MTKKNKPGCKPELLLPAGDFDGVRAAVQNGADAVYLGGKDFSARQNAENFDGDGLKTAVSYCHARGVKVHQALNILLFDRQLAELETAVRFGCENGVDAFIVQDWGVFDIVRELCPDMRLHASTQMTVHTPEGALLLREQGADRVVLARELSLGELTEITAAARSVGLETEVFVHGALCMSVSGQCYLSGMLGGRSGNRGSCAGTCRLPFAPPGEKGYALSLKDNCLAEQLAALAEIGVDSLKVEGRMKRPEYVAAAAAAYSAALRGEPVELESLRAVFSRSGFTNGYFTGRREDMFGIRSKEDVTAATGKLLRGLENTYQKEKGSIPVDMRLTAHEGEPVRLEASDPDGNRAEAVSAPPEKAVNRPSAAEELEERLAKLGGSIFCPGRITVELGEGLRLSAALVNELRRQAVENLTGLRMQLSAVVCGEALSPLPAALEPAGKPAFRARFERFEQLPVDLLPRLERFSLPPEEALMHWDELEPWAGKLEIEPPRAMFGTEKETETQLKKLRELGAKRLLCQNAAHIRMGRRLGFRLCGGAFLNVTNSRSIDALRKMGIGEQILSFELSLTDARQIRAAIPLGLVVSGSLPLMLTRNCPLRQYTGCGKDCKGTGELDDRKDVRFRVACHGRRYAELYNSVPLWMGDRQRELDAFSYLVLYFTGESQAECRGTLTRFWAGEEAGRPFTRGLYYRNI